MTCMSSSVKGKRRSLSSPFGTMSENGLNLSCSFLDGEVDGGLEWHKPPPNGGTLESLCLQVCD